MRALPLCAALPLLGLFLPRADAANIDLRPTQITIQADSGETVLRTLQLRLGADIGDLSAQPMELIYEKQARALPVRLIHVSPVVMAATGQARTVSFTLEISLRGVPAGEYSGDLPFTYTAPNGGGEVKLPLKISVRHSWPMPLLVLLFGVGASVGLSVYRARGRPRDQVLLRIGLVRAFVQRDRALSHGILPVYQEGGSKDIRTNPFKTSLEAALMDVELSLQSERWDEARAKMDQGDALLRKWIQGRLAWIEQLAYLVRLQQRLEARPGSDRYLQALRSASSDLIANAPAQESAQALRSAAQQLSDRIEEHDRAVAKLDALESLRGKLPPAEVPAWSTRIAELHGRLDDMRPDEKAVAGLVAEIDAALQELRTAVRQAAEPVTAPLEHAGTELHAAAVVSEVSPMEPVPEAHLASLFADTPAGAQGRLRWFLYISYAVTLGLLAGTGFNEVYVKKVTFGADLWADYFALLIWGFGAEATRDSVTTTLRGFSSPADVRPADAKGPA